MRTFLLGVLMVGLAACSAQSAPAEADCSQLDSYRIPAAQLMEKLVDYGYRLNLEDPGSRAVAEKSVQELLGEARALPCAEQHPEKQADLEGALLALQEAVKYAKRGDQIDVFRSMEKVKAHINSFNDWSGAVE